MASVTYGNYAYGLNDLAVRSRAATPVTEDLDAAQELEYTPEFQSGSLMGDDAKKAVISFVTGGKFKISAGSLSSAAAAIVTGQATATSGTTPNEETTLTISPADRMPYFDIGGKALDDDAGDVHVYLDKCKLTGGMVTKFANGAWFTNGMEGEIVGDVRIVQNETATALAWS